MNNFFTGTIDNGRARAAKLILRLQHEFLAPLYANAYALILNQVFAAGLGVIYWALAAHLFSADVVGQNSAIISTMIFLSALAELSLKAAMGRFVPRAGHYVTRLILSAYTINISISLLVTLVFFALGNYFRFTIDLLEETRVLPVILIFVPLFWTIFTVQDGVLIGLRESKWVLYENTFFNVIKIVFLVVAFLIGYRYSLAASWFLPVPLLILGVNSLIFLRFIPRYRSENNSPASAITVKQVASSVAGDHIGNILSEACVSLLPLMVLNLVGESANAYFYQAWLIGNTIYLIASNLVTSFSVEASFNLQQIAVYSRRILMQKARLVMPLALVVLIFAPLILRIFGSEYASQGTTLLRWLAIATFPMMLNLLYFGYSRVLGDIRPLIQNQAIIAFITLGLSYLWLPKFGISAVGVAWFIAQSAVAVIAIYKMGPILLSRVSNHSSDEALSGHLLLRRVDWRFLTSVIYPRKSICYTKGRLAQAVAAITSDQMMTQKDDSATDCDLAVAANPSSSVLKAAHLALRSGGVCYTEWDAWRMGGAHRIRRQLETAGFNSIRLFWVYPKLETPHVWVPIESGVGLYKYLAQQALSGDTSILRFARMALQKFLHTLVRFGLVLQLSAIAYKEVESPDDFIGVIRKEWSDAYGDGSADRLSYLFRTPGTHAFNGISYTVFDSNKADPEWILKIPRLPETGGTLEQEYSILCNLNESQKNPALLVPCPLFSLEHLSVRITCQTAFKGILLPKMIRGKPFETLANEITDWLLKLAERSRTDWPHLSKEQPLDQLRVRLNTFGESLLEPKELSRALASLATLKELPLVCVHNDFTPWNLIREHAGLGAFDWVESDWSGYPLLDLVYSLSTLAFLSEDAWETSQTAAVYRRLLDPVTPIGKAFADCLNRYADSLNIPHQRIPALRLATWIFHCSNEYENNRMDFGTEGLSGRTIAGDMFPLLKTELVIQSENS